MSRKRVLTTLVLGFFALACYSPAFGQKVTITREYVPGPVTTTTIQPTGSRVFDYYPDSEVYFNPSSKLWFWQDQGRWQSGSELPAMAAPAPRKVRMEIDEDNPSAFHEHLFRPKMVKKVVPPIAPTATEYRYTYYPDSEIFYDTTARKYLWRDGSTWRMADAPPSTFQIDSAKARTVAFDTDVRLVNTP